MMKILTAIVISISAIFLAGCAQKQSRIVAEAKEDVTSRNIDCTPIISQNGGEIQPKQERTYVVYDLQAKPFVVSVPSVECNPSMAETGFGNAIILGAMRSVFSPIGFEMAGSPADHVVPADRNIVFTLMDEDFKLHAAAVQEHKALCALRKDCPTLIKAYRSYWPFTEEGSGKSRPYAEISAIPPNQTLGKIGSKQQIFVAVYTSHLDRAVKMNHLKLLQVYPIKFSFH